MLKEILLTRNKERGKKVNALKIEFTTFQLVDQLMLIIIKQNHLIHPKLCLAYSISKYENYTDFPNFKNTD